MPKMPQSSVLDAASDLADRPLGKSQRNLKNVERAFIAASRRTDRDPEARLHSARRASKIHKQRTGKALKISREIVLREEMYEEEDDEMPRSFRAFATNPQTSTSPSTTHMNYSSNADMAKIAHQAEIERRFAEQFPSLQLSRRQPLARAGHLPSLQHGPSPLHLRTASLSRYQPDVPDATNEVSPLMPPVSYPLPPTPKSRSISPVALASATSRPASASSDPLPASAQAPADIPAIRRWTVAGIPDDPSLQPPLFGIGMPGEQASFQPMAWEEQPVTTQPMSALGLTDSLAEFTLASSRDSGMVPPPSEAYPQDLFQTDTPAVQSVYPPPPEPSWQTATGSTNGDEDSFVPPSLDNFTFNPAIETTSSAADSSDPPSSRRPSNPASSLEVSDDGGGTGAVTPSVAWATWLNMDEDGGVATPGKVVTPAVGGAGGLGVVPAAPPEVQVVAAQV